MKSFATLLFVVSVFAFPVQAENFLKSCPCGPDAIKGPFRQLLIQGFKGADFRPSCRKHDACYDTLGANREACDKAFLRNLLADCRNSKHPNWCRRKARITHWFVDRLGSRAFQSAQVIAAEKQK